MHIIYIIYVVVEAAFHDSLSSFSVVGLASTLSSHRTMDRVV
jgi:hypothetical protein